MGTAAGKEKTMKKILIIDGQKWIVDLFYEALYSDGYLVSIAPDANGILKYIKANRFDLVLLSLYLRYGYYSWDILQEIKALAPSLPVIIVAAYDKYLYTPQLKLAQGYVINSCSAVEELRQKIRSILRNETAGIPNAKTELVL